MGAARLRLAAALVVIGLALGYLFWRHVWFYRNPPRTPPAEAGLVSPAHLLVDTFPAEQGSQRVTDATTLYKAQKNSCTSLNVSARRAPCQTRA